MRYKQKDSKNIKPMVSKTVITGLPKLVEQIDLSLAMLSDNETLKAYQYVKALSDYYNSQEYVDKSKRQVELKYKYQPKKSS